MSNTIWTAFRIVSGAFLVASGPYVFVYEENRLLGIAFLVVGLVWLGGELWRQYQRRRPIPDETGN
ncbi:hypothetical protein HTG_18110 [Natrinema mahii]|nr:hypothetical protein HTG_18110 [Natrinema mahii]